MKKMITVIACVLMVLCLSACGEKKDVSNSKYVGTWKIDDTMSGYGETSETGSDWTITLNPDGTAVSVSSDSNDNCTWQETSKGFKLKGDLKLNFTDDGDGVATKFLGVELRFHKQ